MEINEETEETKKKKKTEVSTINEEIQALDDRIKALNNGKEALRKQHESTLFSRISKAFMNHHTILVMRNPTQWALVSSFEEIKNRCHYKNKKPIGSENQL